jgi:hypothetical protein
VRWTWVSKSRWCAQHPIPSGKSSPLPSVLVGLSPPTQLTSEKQHKFSLFFPFLFWHYWGLNSGFALARQMLYCLNHTPAIFSSGYSRDRVSLFAQGSLDQSSVSNFLQ